MLMLTVRGPYQYDSAGALEEGRLAQTLRGPIVYRGHYASTLQELTPGHQSLLGRRAERLIIFKPTLRCNRKLFANLVNVLLLFFTVIGDLEISTICIFFYNRKTIVIISIHASIHLNTLGLA